MRTWASAEYFSSYSIHNSRNPSDGKATDAKHTANALRNDILEAMSAPQKNSETVIWKTARTGAEMVGTHALSL